MNDRNDTNLVADLITIQSLVEKLNCAGLESDASRKRVYQITSELINKALTRITNDAKTSTDEIVSLLARK